MPIILTCATCGHDLAIKDSDANREFPCPKCGKPVHGPDQSAAGTTTGSSDHNQTIATPSPLSGKKPAFDFLSAPKDSDELGGLAHYRVVKLLGQGGMGMVFKAVDSHLQRAVALKVIRPEMSKEIEFRERFLREARATAAVRSDHIVTIHHVGLENDVPFLAMEFLQGETLEDRLERDGPVSVADTVRLGIEMARGLAAAHDMNLVHRDIKPANIWIEQGTNRVKILDFGLARPSQSDNRLTAAGIVMGTPDYMAPEQAEGVDVDHRCDLFSLGCVLYQMVSGQKPFQGTSTLAVLKAVALKEPTPLLKVSPKTPRSLAELIGRLMAKDPKGRPASAHDVVKALEAIQGNPSVRLAALESSSGSGGHKVRDLMLVGGLVAFALLAYFLFTYTFPGGGGNQGRTGPRPTAQGVSDTEIVFGLSGPLSGPSRELGRQMELGINTFFYQVNDQGGIGGRKLRLISMDDEYDPAKALARVQELDKDQKVFGFVGNIGTPTAQKTLPYAIEKNLLFFGAFTGSRILRQTPPDRVVFNYRASYTEETATIVRYLVENKNIKPEEIAVFAQMDGYGDDGFRGVAHGLKKYGRKEDQILRVGYSRSKLDINDAVDGILKRPEIKAVVMVATYEPAALFIQRVKDARKDMLFTNVSFVGSNALAEKLLQYGPNYAEGVLVTQVVPLPTSGTTVAMRYRELLKKYFPKEHPGFNSLEGYITAAILCEGLKRAGDNLNTETLIASLESIKELDLGLGATITYAPSDHQALKKVWITKMDSSGVFQNVDVDD